MNLTQLATLTIRSLVSYSEAQPRDKDGKWSDSGDGAANIMHTKTGGAAGTNAGGFYKGVDGRDRYVKSYGSPTQAHGEAVANTIYRDLGVNAPKSIVFKTADGTKFASEVIQGGKTLQSIGLSTAAAREVLKGYAADVLVGNWDVIGLVNDNILMKDGQAHRVDNGASFFHRAQGGKLKPENLLHQTTEFEGFLNPSINREYSRLAAVAGVKTTADIPDLKEQVRKIVTLQDSHDGWSSYLDKKAPYLSATDHDKMAAMLTARTKSLATKVGISIHAGGPGSGWFTESPNPHVGHAQHTPLGKHIALGKKGFALKHSDTEKDVYEHAGGGVQVHVSHYNTTHPGNANLRKYTVIHKQQGKLFTGHQFSKVEDALKPPGEKTVLKLNKPEPTSTDESHLAKVAVLEQHGFQYNGSGGSDASVDKYQHPNGPSVTLDKNSGLWKLDDHTGEQFTDGFGDKKLEAVLQPVLQDAAKANGSGTATAFNSLQQNATSFTTSTHLTNAGYKFDHSTQSPSKDVADVWVQKDGKGFIHVVKDGMDNSVQFKSGTYAGDTHWSSTAQDAVDHVALIKQAETPAVAAPKSGGALYTPQAQQEYLTTHEYELQPGMKGSDFWKNSTGSLILVHTNTATGDLGYTALPSGAKESTQQSNLPAAIYHNATKQEQPNAAMPEHEELLVNSGFKQTATTVDPVTSQWEKGDVSVTLHPEVYADKASHADEMSWFVQQNTFLLDNGHAVETLGNALLAVKPKPTNTVVTPKVKSATVATGSKPAQPTVPASYKNKKLTDAGYQHISSGVDPDSGQKYDMWEHPTKDNVPIVKVKATGEASSVFDAYHPDTLATITKDNSSAMQLQNYIANSAYTPPPPPPPDHAGNYSGITSMSKTMHESLPGQVSDAWNKYNGDEFSGAPSRKFSDNDVTSWSKEYNSLVQKGDTPGKETMVKAAQGKGLYPEVAAKMGMNPAQLNTAMQKIKSWTGSSTDSFRKQAQAVRKQEPGADPGLALEYAVTQKGLQELHPDGIVNLYRGLKSSQLVTPGSENITGQVFALRGLMHLKGWTAEFDNGGAASWSTSKGTADGFKAGQFGVVINQSDLPIKDVLTTHITNPVAFSGHGEQEYIVAPVNGIIPISHKKTKITAAVEGVLDALQHASTLRQNGWTVTITGKTIKLTPPEPDYNWLQDMRGKGVDAAYPLEGKTAFQGLPISIETKQGSTRSGTKPDGTKWSVVMPFDYGYIRGTMGVDGDHVDCFIGPNPDAKFAYVIHQTKIGSTEYDEDKVMLGWNSSEAAKKAYCSAFDDGKGTMHSMTVMPMSTFIQKVLKTGKQKRPGKLHAHTVKEMGSTPKVAEIRAKLKPLMLAGRETPVRKHTKPGIYLPQRSFTHVLLKRKKD